MPHLNRLHPPRDQSAGRKTDVAMIDALRKVDYSRPIEAIGLPWSAARRPS
jgi:hypothetical protein